MKFNKSSLLSKLKNITLNKKFYFILLIAAIIVIILTSALKERSSCDLNYISPTATDLQGIDVSNHQGSIKWGKVDSEVVSFIFIKATEGLTYKDQYFNKNWNETSKNGFLKSAYHFYDVNSDGLKQAKHFIAVVPKEECTLPPAVDIEKISDMKQGKVILEIKKYLEKIEAHYGIKPIIYANIDTYNLYIKDIFKDYLIWFPTYNTDAPAIANLTFWQYTDSGSVKGITGPVDFNKFNGNGADLLKLKVRYK